MKLGLVAASLVLVAGGAAGCSDDGDGGNGGDDTASRADFCGALGDFETDVSAVDANEDLPGYIKALKDGAEKLDEVGTPDGMPEDAEEGFDLTIERIGDLPDDATRDDVSAMGDLSDADQKKSDALSDYIAKECPDLGVDSSPSAATESPTESPS